MKRSKNGSRGLLPRSVGLAVVAAAFVVYGTVTGTAAAQKASDAQNAANSAQRGIYPQDGVFAGSAKGYGGITEVNVTVENGYITKVEVTSCLDDHPYIDNVEDQLVPDLIAKQTTTIDVVTNASYSSNGVRFAVRDALRSANNMPDSEQALINANAAATSAETDTLSIGYLMSQQDKQKRATNTSGIAGGR